MAKRERTKAMFRNMLAEALTPAPSKTTLSQECFITYSPP